METDVVMEYEFAEIISSLTNRQNSGYSTYFDVE